MSKKVTFDFFNNSIEESIEKISEYFQLDEQAVIGYIDSFKETSDIAANDFTTTFGIKLAAYDSNNAEIICRHMTTTTEEVLEEIKKKGLLDLIGMLKSYNNDEIDYKCYQIERDQEIHFTDELGIKLLFLLYLFGDDSVKDILLNIREGLNYISKYGLKFDYYPSDICIHDLSLDKIPISAQHHILEEYINMNWKKFKEYAVECIQSNSVTLLSGI